MRPADSFLFLARVFRACIACNPPLHTGTKFPRRKHTRNYRQDATRP